MELKQVGEKTYYIEHETNIGVYQTGEDTVCLIDTGSAGDGELIDEIISGQGWSLDYIINTHTHIDHLGGNAYLMAKYGVPAYCTDIDMAFAHYTDLEAAYMNGGKPSAKLRRIFAHPGNIGFRAIDGGRMGGTAGSGNSGTAGDRDDDTAKDRDDRAAGSEDSGTAGFDDGCTAGDGAIFLPGISWTYLPGHTFGMIGVKTEDDVWFLGDAYLSREYLTTHRFGYLCDVGAYLDTLEKLKNFTGTLFIPSHGAAEADLAEITALNRKNVLSIAEAVRRLCRNGAPLDTILQGMYREFGMRNNIANHVLLSSTIKCYLTWMQDAGELSCSFEDDKMIWKAIG